MLTALDLQTFRLADRYERCAVGPHVNPILALRHICAAWIVMQRIQTGAGKDIRRADVAWRRRLPWHLRLPPLHSWLHRRRHCGQAGKQLLLA